MRARLDSAPLTLAVAFGMLLLVGGWDAVTADSRASATGAVLIVIVAVTGLAGRTLRLPGELVALIQVSALAAAPLLLVWLTDGPDARDALPGELVGAGYVLASGRAPIEPSPGVIWLIAVLAGALALAADSTAATLERPGWAAVPLLVAYSVPALSVPGQASPSHFARLGVAVVVVLAARGIGRRERHPGGRHGLVTRATAAGVAALVGAGAIGGAILIGDQVRLKQPVSAKDSPIEMSDPSLDLKRNLVEGSPDAIIWFRTDRPDPPPLRLVSLTRFTDSGFHLAETKILRGPFARAPGAQASNPRRLTEVEIGDFASEWLPVPYAPVAVSVDDQWGHTEDGLEVLALGFPGRTSASTGMSYSVTSADVRPESDVLERASAGRPPNSATTMEIPQGVSSRMLRLANQVTASAKTDGQRALAIESFLRSEPFRYSTAPAPGTGVAGLEEFLFETQEGYCEQFAGAMAAMSRLVGIPSRIGIGFNPGEQDSDGVFQVSARNMHAWPELYFDDLGWVAFEPTPGQAGVGEPEPAPVEPSPEPASPQTPPPSVDEPEPEIPAGADEGPPAPLKTTLGVLVALALLGAAAGVPRGLRVWQRNQRLDPSRTGRDAALAAWAELRATASDLGMEWPDGSPRYVAERLAQSHEPGEGASDPLERVALATERALYADPKLPLPKVIVGEDASAVVNAWRAHATPAQRRRATWWPRSIWSGRKYGHLR